MTNEEALTYAREVRFCAGCNEYQEDHACDMCDHRGFFETTIAALEKQIPKKPIWHVLSKYKNGNVKKGAWKCPTCLRIEYVNRRDALDTYCGFCGQKIDYEGVEE